MSKRIIPKFKKMNTNKIIENIDRKVMLSTLWIFATFNYIYADVFSVYFEPGAQQEAIEFTNGQENAVLMFAILMETAIAMVLFSRILKYKINRIANIIVGVLHTLAVAGSLIADSPTMYYLFFASAEIICTLFIVWYAWKWHESEVRV